MKHGYTLVEILVGITIIGLLFSFGFVSFRDFSRRQALAGAVKSVQGDLRLAQELALAGQKPADCGLRILDNYGFRRVSSTGYQIEAGCSDVSGPMNVVVKTVTLAGGAEISAPSPNPVSFKALGHGTNIDVGMSATLTLTQTGAGNPVTLTITAGGEIK